METMDQGLTPVICITGGPCAGKTTILSILQQQLTDTGLTVITVAEAATEFIVSGLHPAALGRLNFQRYLFEHIIEKENRWKKAAALIQAKKKVILCDRGVVDAAAYIEPAEFDALLKDCGYNIVDLRDRRYNAVIFLQSVAEDAPEIYTRINNLARSETLEEARRINQGTLNVWLGHPYMTIIDNSTSVEGKAKKAFEVICNFLGGRRC